MGGRRSYGFSRATKGAPDTARCALLYQSLLEAPADVSGLRNPASSLSRITPWSVFQDKPNGAPAGLCQEHVDAEARHEAYVATTINATASPQEFLSPGFGRRANPHRSTARADQPGHSAIIGFDNDPSAGSPTETLFRLLLPLNDKVALLSSGDSKSVKSNQSAKTIPAREPLVKCIYVYTEPVPRNYRSRVLDEVPYVPCFNLGSIKNVLENVIMSLIVDAWKIRVLEPTSENRVHMVSSRIKSRQNLDSIRNNVPQYGITRHKTLTDDRRGDRSGKTALNQPRLKS
ncbi:hypothetical protein AgCh_033908 [Apium graveolens]